MNIVTKSTLLLAVTLVAGLIPIQSYANVFGGSGRYVMMPYGNGNLIIWMLNTETGEIRKCMEQMKPDPPKCGPWSEE